MRHPAQQYRQFIEDLIRKMSRNKAVQDIVVRLAPLRRQPRLLAVAPVTFELLVLFLAGWMTDGSLVLQQSFWLLPLPLFVYLFLKRADKDAPGLYSAIPLLHFAGVSFVGFIIAFFASGLLHLLALAATVGAGLFIFMVPGAFLTLVGKRRQAAEIAAAGGLSGIAYYWAQVLAWKTLAAATANSMYFLLMGFISQLNVFAKGQKPVVVGLQGHGHTFHRIVPVRVPTRTFHAPMTNGHPPVTGLNVPHPPIPRNMTPDFMAIASDHYTYRIYLIENIGVGLCLFLFLFCLQYMMSGKQMPPRRLGMMLLGGMALMFIGNALFAASYFLLADMALTPGASPMLLSVGKAVSVPFIKPWVGFACYIIGAMLLVKFYFRDTRYLAYPVKLLRQLKR